MLPVGKLPASLLAQLLEKAPRGDPQVILGPGPGLDCAVVEVGDTLLVFKSDPITFVTEAIGWYMVQVNVNDIATTGALPRWLLATILLPERRTSTAMAERLVEQVYDACRELDIVVIGGHTEITYGLNRPIVVGTLIGEVHRDRLITPRGAKLGDRILLTKGIPIEATAILAREFPERLAGVMSDAELKEAQAFLTAPGISVLGEARIAIDAGRVTAMHDPTEGGLASALWELSEACGHSLILDPQAVPIPQLSARICRVFGLDPFAAISSGSLLLTAPSEDSRAIRNGLNAAGIECADIGYVEGGSAGVWRLTGRGREKLIRPLRDELTRVFES